MYQNKIEILRLYELLNYNPETGIFTWKIRRNGRCKAGDVAGTKTKDGYIDIRIDFGSYGAHRVAFAMTHGYWPEADIDHIDGNRSNNRPSNLRIATRGRNLQNQRRAHTDNKTGFLGVTKRGRRFSAKITHQYKTYELGTYDTPEKAHQAYLFAKRLMHPTCTI